MNRRLKIYAVVILLARATLSCAPMASGQVKDTCSVVAATDAEAVLGEPVMPPQKESHNSSTLQISTCRFLPSRSQGKMLSVMLHLTTASNSANILPMAAYLKNMNFASVQQLSGIGTDAAWGSITVAGKLICQMYARKDATRWIAIIVTGVPDNPDTLTRVKTLANQVLSKLE
jgi:hypothetical protein